MCGIAGFSLSSEARVERTLAAQALLAAIAERGADAVGYAHRAPGIAAATVVKQRTPASELLERVEVSERASQLLIHVRDYTKGHPSIESNNHPVRHGPVVGIHNGIIVNDDELLDGHACARPGEMTVDSEAIFALAAHTGNDVQALEQLRGAMAAAWIDEREPELLHVARGTGRPLWLGESREGIVFASTKHALELVERYCALRLRTREVRQGTKLTLRAGEIASHERFRVAEYVEPDPLPAVRAPQEREVCLSRLALIATAI